MRDLVMAIAGSGGDGVITAGDFIIQASARRGLNAFMLKSYGPQIRGGESSAKIRLADERLFSQGDLIDILVVFNWKDYRRFTDELVLREGAVVLYDDDDPTPEEAFPVEAKIGARFIPVPFKRLAGEELKVPLAKNMVALGVIGSAVGLSLSGLKDAVMEKFGKHKPEAAQINLEAIELGRHWLEENLSEPLSCRLEDIEDAPKLVMTGNDAFAYGAIHAGLSLYAGYPITPASTILELCSKYLPAFGGTVLQTEDEIAAATMCLGASWAGKKVMTASSGPGISLMQEAIGLAAMAELPLVVVNVQRVGPSTGIPSKNEQADLFQALGGTHGDAPRVVLAPTEVADAFWAATEAFRLSETYQLPAIVLSDQFIGERSETVMEDQLFSGVRRAERRLPNEEDLQDYRRYHLGEGGVSPMAVPGMRGGQHVISGLEHDEYGRPTSSALLHEHMSDKRAAKMEALAEEEGFLQVFGDEDAELALISWGSSKGSALEALNKLREEGQKVKLVILRMLFPVQAAQLDRVLANTRRVVVFELSHTGQLYRLLRAFYDNLPIHTVSYARVGGNPLTAEEARGVISRHLRELSETLEA